MKNKYLVIALLLSSLALNAQTNEIKPAEDLTKILAEANTPVETNNSEIKNIGEALLELFPEFEEKNAEQAILLEKNSNKINAETPKNENTDVEIIKVEPKNATENLSIATTEKRNNITTTTVENTTKTKEANELKPLSRTTTTTVVKELNLVEPTKHNWWKWLGLLALLGALIGFLFATFKRQNYDKDSNDHQKKNRNSDREVQFTFEEEKEDKGSDKRNHNKDNKN